MFGLVIHYDEVRDGITGKVTENFKPVRLNNHGRIDIEAGYLGRICKDEKYCFIFGYKTFFLLQNDPNYLSLVKLFNKQRG